MRLTATVRRTPLATIVRVTPLRMRVEVPEREVDLVERFRGGAFGHDRVDAAVCEFAQAGQAVAVAERPSITRRNHFQSPLNAFGHRSLLFATGTLVASHSLSTLRS